MGYPENLQKYEFTSVSDFLGIEVELESKIEKQITEVQQPQTAAQQSVSIVIPCYNEESALPYLANTLRSVESELSNKGFKSHLVFVDDYSSDSTLKN